MTLNVTFPNTINGQSVLQQQKMLSPSEHLIGVCCARTFKLYSVTNTAQQPGLRLKVTVCSEATDSSGNKCFLHHITKTTGFFSNDQDVATAAASAQAQFIAQGAMVSVPVPTQTADEQPITCENSDEETTAL